WLLGYQGRRPGRRPGLGGQGHQSVCGAGRGAPFPRGNRGLTPSCRSKQPMLNESFAKSTAAVGDDRLRLIFTCCHPALAVNARVALTLRLLGGLQTDQIARAFLVSEPTMAQRLVRAKAKIRA